MCGDAGDVGVRLRLEDFNVLRCRRCELVFLDLPTSSERLQGLYGADYFGEREAYFFGDTVDPARDARSNANVAEFEDGLRKLVALLPERGRLLDVGCGVGAFLSLARTHGWDVRGVDISSFASRYAREQVGVEVDEGTLEGAAYAEGSFDVVTLWDSIEHVADPPAVLREVRRILKPGGYVMLNTPNEAGLLKLLARVCYRATLGVFRYPARKLYHVYHLYYFTPPTLVRMLEREGLELVTLERSLIPIVKARGTALEKLIVRLVSGLESATGREYQLLAIARNP